jgi:hypothetical protein
MNRRTSPRKVLRRQPPARPTVSTLLTHIAASAFTGGMFLVLVFGGAIITFLFYNNYQPDNLLVLLFGTIIIMAFYRGCLAWQQDLDEYRSQMSGMRHACKSKSGTGSDTNRTQ